MLSRARPEVEVTSGREVFNDGLAASGGLAAPLWRLSGSSDKYLPLGSVVGTLRIGGSLVSCRPCQSLHHSLRGSAMAAALPEVVSA
jgi:hypothetical protein